MTRIGDLRGTGARRGLDWTGERVLPWTDDAAIAYEHLHRYAFAAGLVDGRRVLDLGCGEGYGAALLAAAGAAEVVGVDVDAEAVEHARATYRSDRLRFERASADDLSGFEDGAFDVVVCFEVVEHVSAQEALVSEVRRVLAAGGVFACSTPEREAYRSRTGTLNPFHVRELSEAEFRVLLAGAFDHVAIWSQVTSAGSLLAPLQEAQAPAEVVHVGRVDGYWDLREPPPPLYLVALASNAPLPARPVSVLADAGLGLSDDERRRLQRELHEARLDRARAEELILGYKAGMERREAEVREVVAVADGLRAELLAAGDRIGRLDRELKDLKGSSAHRVAEAARRLAGRLR